MNIPGSATTALVNGRITIEPARSDEVSAIAISAGRVVAVGTDDEILARVDGAARVIDLEGRRAIPGLIDSHMHIMRAGQTWTQDVDWTRPHSLADALEMIRAAAQERPSDRWVTVFGGWHPGQFEERVGPTPDDLTRVAPDHPVFVQFLYGEGYLNRVAVDLLRGRADFDELVAPSVLSFSETGGATLKGGPVFNFLRGVIGLPDLETQVASTRTFMRRLNETGLVGAIDFGGGSTGPDSYRALHELWRREELGFRVRLYLSAYSPATQQQDLETYFTYMHPGFGDEWLTLTGIGEQLHHGFRDLEGLSDWHVDEKAVDELAAVLLRAATLGWPVHMHAVRRQTVKAAIDAFERVAEQIPLHDKTFSLAHAEPISDEDVVRLARLGMGVGIQNRFMFRAADSKAAWQDDVDLQAAPPLRRFIDQGVPLGAGTDSTVVTPYNPWLCLWWLVSGRALDGSQPRSEPNRLTRHEALHMYTRGSAWFSREQHERGGLTVGDRGDVAVLSDDYFTVEEDGIRDIRSVLTVVGGQVVHDELGTPTRTSSN